MHLLLDVLPHVAEEECFALHGGTAINLFVRDMPRLSVDIDLTYLPMENRQETLEHIHEALGRIRKRVESVLLNTQVIDKSDIGKLLVSERGEEIKLEVNLVSRGSVKPSKHMMLCDKAQSTYDLSAVINVIHFGQLYGGKICAALSRQHPRDLFDVKILLENEEFSDEVRHGFLLCLLCSDKPISDMLA